MNIQEECVYCKKVLADFDRLLEDYICESCAIKNTHTCDTCGMRKAGPPPTEIGFKKVRRSMKDGSILMYGPKGKWYWSTEPIMSSKCGLPCNI